MKKTKLFNNRLITLTILFVIAILNFPVGNTFALDTTPILGTAIVSNTSNLIYFTSATYNANVVISDPDPENSNARQISGYAWSVDLGWIEFTDNTTPGVYVDYTTGEVSGSAYVLNTENLLDFDNYGSNVVFDDETGILSGFVWSEDVGWVDFGSDQVYMQDVIDPTGSVGINSGDTYTTTTSVTLNITGTDQAPSQGIDEMMVCNDAGFSGCTWEPYSTTKLWTLTSGDGEKTVYLKLRDAGLNESTTYSDTITLDTTGPTGSVSVNGGDSYANTTSVDLTISASDTYSGIDEMMVCNDAGFSGCTWEPYSTTKSWTLTSGDEEKTVYIKFRDTLDNESTTYNDTITLDTTGPTGSISVNGGDSYANTTSVDLTISASDTYSGIDEMMVCNDSGFSGCSWESYSTTKSWTLTSGEGTKTVYIRFKDTLGNESSTYTDNIIYDNTAPTGSININSGSSSTTSPNVTLTLSATDIGSGISQMMICNASSFSGCTWESYSTSKSWTLTDGDGTKTVYVKYKDGIGMVSTIYSDTIELSTPVPPVVTTTPPVVTYTPPVVEEEEVEEEEEVFEEETTTEETSEEETTYETEVKQVSGVTEYSELKVRVKDDVGKPLANTLVKMANQSQMTDLEGIATFRNIRAGDYTLEYEYNGKKAVKGIRVENLDVKDGEKVVLNVMEITPEEEKSSIPVFYLVLIPILLLIILTVLITKKNNEEMK